MARTAHTVKQKEEIASRKSKRISAKQQCREHLDTEGIDASQFEDADLEPSDITDDSEAPTDPNREAERTDAVIPLLALGKSVLPVDAPHRTLPSTPVPGNRLSPGKPPPPHTVAHSPTDNMLTINGPNGQHTTSFLYQSNPTPIPLPGQVYTGHQYQQHAGPSATLLRHPTREELLGMSLDELKDLAARRALSRPFIAETIRNKQKYVYPDHPHKVPCPARMMGPTHTFQNAFFVVPPTTLHGSELRCSHRFCRQNRIKFLFCAYCKAPVTRMKFDIRHAHKDKSGGDDQEAASILASLVGEQNNDQETITQCNEKFNQV